MSTRLSSPTQYEVSENGSFFEIVTNVTDNFTCCIRTYESLLPYFEEETTSNGYICNKFFKLDEIIRNLNTELTTLKLDLSSGVYYNSKLTEQSVQKEIIPESENKDNKSKCVSNERRVEESEIFPSVTNVKKPIENLNEGHSYEKIDFLSTASGEEINKKKQSKHIETKPIVVNETAAGINSQNDKGITENEENKHPSNTYRSKIDKALSKQLYKAEGGSFNNIWLTEFGFECTLCDKQLSGSKVILQHVKGSYHQSLLTNISNKTTCNQERKNDINIKSKKASIEIDAAALEKTANLRNVLRGVSHIHGSADLYILHAKSAILCALCQCQIPPTIQNVSDHLLGGNHFKKKNELLNK